MLFQALTGAPSLREGVTINFMAVPQPTDQAPDQLSPGARVTLRFGYCCPQIAEGQITARSLDPDRVVLNIADMDWTLEPRLTGISIAGIVSENWIVRGAA